MDEIKYTCVERFLKYITFDTQSMEDSPSFPSTEKQKKLAEYLVQELREMGLANADMDDWSYVTATLDSNVDYPVPAVGLIAHLDTSPDVSGQDVKAQIHKNYQGGTLVISKELGVLLNPEENKDMANQIGHDIITSDGSTLLGADNKAGIAEILDAVNYFITHPHVKHGTIKIAVMPDEEIGCGSDHFDIAKFAADYAYTIDGETLGEIEDETFCADAVTIEIKGVNVHPGYGKNKLINSIKIAAKVIEALPQNSLSPETTEKREGYVHPYVINGGVEVTTIKFLIRDFTVEGLQEKEKFLQQLTGNVLADYPKAAFVFKVDEYYRNMKYMLDTDPKVVDYALEAVERSGIKPKRNLIRGGTDGAKLSYKGLLTPNIFTGGHNFHARSEWISIYDMQKAVDVIVNLIKIWEEKSR